MNDCKHKVIGRIRMTIEWPETTTTARCLDCGMIWIDGVLQEKESSGRSKCKSDTTCDSGSKS